MAESEASRGQIIKDFQVIPGVGKSIAADLYNLGFRSLEEIKRSDPETMYQNLCVYQGGRIDRCVLYVFRCASYFLNNASHDRELLKWWNWKD